jgi:hypothetical protein
MRAMSIYLGSSHDLQMSRHSALSFASSGEMKKTIVSNTNEKAQDDDKATEQKIRDGEVSLSPSPSYVCVADRSPREQLTATPFIFLCMFFGFNVAGTNWNLVTQLDFLAGLGDDDQIYLTIFTLLTPISILGGPFIDWSILNLGWTLTLQVVNVLAVGFQVVKIGSDNLNVQIVGFVVFSFYRSFLFGVSFSYLPTLVSGDVLGKAVGIMTGFAGVLNVCLMPVTNVAIENGEGDFFGANLGILCFSIPCIFFICGLGRYNTLELAAEEAKNGVTETRRLSMGMVDSVDEQEGGGGEDDEQEEDGEEEASNLEATEADDKLQGSDHTVDA